MRQISAPQPYRFTIAEYYAMAEHCLLPDRGVELLEGEVIAMPPMGSPQAAGISHLNQLLVLAVDDAAFVRCRLPVRQEPDSEPMPDIAVVRPRTNYYSASHPTPADVLLAIEVSDSSLAYDRDRKLPLYRAWGIPEVWIVNLPLRVIHVSRAPSASELTYRPGERIRVPELPAIDFAVNDILP